MSDLASRSGKDSGTAGKESATKWRMKVVEALDKAPEKWTAESFDDSAWDQTALPISWHMNHTVLLRSSFEIQDGKAVDALRLRMWVFRQQNIMIYINGQLVGKVNQAANSGNMDARLNEGALRALRNGRNSIAVTCRHNWRWGVYFSHSETEASNSVYNNGVTVLLDRREKQK